MEKYDLKLIEKYSPKDEMLANLYKEHLDYEKELEDLENKSLVTVSDQVRIREIKKKKLLGRDQMEMILSKYRATEKRS